jgi:DNA-binding NarL/FixJ family response regulator
MIRVMVVDDHPIVRAGIVGLLDTEPDFEVIAEAQSGEQAIELVPTVRPDVVLMDLRMPGMGGVDATRRIAEWAAGAAADGPVRVLVFTTYEDDDQILAAIEAGAGGYLVKAAPAEELAAGVRAVAAGQTVLAPSVAAALATAARGRASESGAGDASGSRGASASGDATRVGGASVPTGTGERGAAGGERASDPSPRLTARETEILALVAEGLSNPEIAARLFIGESTVKTHLLHVFEKLAVSDRSRAVIRAMQLDLI